MTLAEKQVIQIAIRRAITFMEDAERVIKANNELTSKVSLNIATTIRAKDELLRILGALQIIEIVG